MSKEKEIRDETNSCKCLLCGEFHKGLTLHLKYKHSTTPKLYREMFPDAEIFSKSVKKQMSENSYVAKCTGMSFDERLGEEKSAQIRKKISDSKKEHTGWTHKEESKQKMKDTWDKNRDEWSQSIRDAWTDERRLIASKKQSQKITKNGYHLSRGRETSLEKKIRIALTQLGYEVITQKGTKRITLGTTRFFDFYIPALNLVIEADGEHWHSSKGRIEIDIEKHNAAITEGYVFLRISDKTLKRSTNEESTREIISQLLKMSPTEMREYSNCIIEARKSKLRD